MTNPVIIERGDSPVILGQPHGGTFVPEAIAARLNDNGRLLADTDWHIDRLYGDLLPGATMVRATFHRYVIDANRDPSGKSLYPGQNTTGLIPLTDFDGKAIWREGKEPAENDIGECLEKFHRPYHTALAAEIERVRQRHGIAILYDCHSIRSRIPFLFEGALPDLNIGTNTGVTCAPEIEDAVTRICAAAPGYVSVLNGRFKGGWTTRHYGRPYQNVHAIQMEIAQSAYLETEAVPFNYDNGKAERLRVYLKTILKDLEKIAASIGGEK
jgi:N-formylglutamate deformylase